MSIEGKIGRNGLNTSQEVGFFGSGLEGRQRSKYPRPANARAFAKGHARMLSMLLVFVAVAAILASAMMALPHSANQQLSRPDLAAEATQGPSPMQPGTPYQVVGYVNNSLGAPVFNAVVTVTNIRNAATWTTTTDAVFGFYMVDVNNDTSRFTLGDTINVTVTSGSLIGWNQSVSSGGFLQLDVVVRATVIPEFSTVVAPVIGMVALVVVIGLRRSKVEMR